MNNDAFEFNDKGLKDLIKSLGDSLPYAKVGILGGKTNRKAQGESNATIGRRHEFGTDKLPIRSFLRVPISDKMQKYINSYKGFNEENLKQVIKDKNLSLWIQQLGALAVQIVGEAFNTSGFGKWRPSIMTRKKVRQTLVETTQLRDSIDFEVKT
jgi:hypothetical protein